MHTEQKNTKSEKIVYNTLDIKVYAMQRERTRLTRISSKTARVQ